MDFRRTERSPFTVPSGSGDLIGDIQRQNRRRILKRAAQITGLALALLLAGFGVKHLADERDRDQVVARVESQSLQGTVVDLIGAIELAELGLQRHPDHVPLQEARGLMRAHLWAEFGVAKAEAEAAVDALQPSAAKTIGEGLLAFASGDIDSAASAQDVVLGEEAPTFERVELDWLRGMVAAARAESNPDGLRATAELLGERVAAGEAGTSLRRVHAYLLLLSGQQAPALAMLAEAREQARSHYGLAADEALFNAHLHQELGGVASVADQLLAMPAEALSPRDRAHAALSRAVAHVAEGEPEDALRNLDDAWPNLAAWNMLARRLAVQTALDAGDTTRYQGWLDASAFTDDEKTVYRAWATLIRGDVMKALSLLEKAPQADPWVGLLQALALVEQNRWEEAKPWVERASKLLPGRHDIEVASARVELRLGDKALALRRLEALAEQEAYAPRAFTGLGEAHLLQGGDGEKDEDGRDPKASRDKKAKRALEKALEREPVPAEAQYLLSGIWHRRRLNDPEAEKRSLDLLRTAADTNPHLPRYRVALASYLADLGYTKEALGMMDDLQGEVGVGWAFTLRHVRLLIERRGPLDADAIETLLKSAEEAGAEALALRKERARLDLRDGSKASLARAQSELEALTTQRPSDADAHVLLAMTLLKQFDRKAADAVCRRAAATVPEDDVGLLRLARANISARVGRTVQAAPMARSAWTAMLESTTRTTADLLETAEVTTRLWTRSKKDAVALRVARELTDRVAYHAEAWIIRARTELAANEAADAKTSAQKALELDPNSPGAHEIHGHTLLRFGDKSGARAEYERAIELADAPDKDTYRENLERL